ncbi:DUF551 domain-containing protein [Salmonella enterica]|uniref:DUF551 domain-containing protein n=1 Tax=Salmonella enterica TaxID=28901 RepID=UPI001F07A9D9|nr:DUF551 domain-containing protein [Salmonella enterica]
MSTITNNKLTDETLKAWKTEAMISLGETPKDCRDYSHHEAILALVTELQELRAAMLQSSQPVSNHDELPYAQVKAVADLYALCWQSGEVVTYTPDPEKATIWLNNYSGTCVQEYVKLERLQEALAGNSPVIPGGWISCSERMPDNDESKPIAIFTGKCLGQGMFVATYDDDGFFDYWEGMEIIGVSHWMQLPDPPL